MKFPLNSVVVQTSCPTCGSAISAPYVQVRATGAFACGCGTVVDADMASVATQALIGLVDEEEPALAGAAS